MDEMRKIILSLTIISLMSVGWGQDSTPPELNYFSFSPDTVNLNNRNPIEFIYNVSDDMSGMDYLQICLIKPNSDWDCIYEFAYDGELEVQDTLYYTIEENQPEGIWTTYISFYDITENHSDFYPDDLEELGFQTEIIVYNDCSIYGILNLFFQQYPEN